MNWGTAGVTKRDLGIAAIATIGLVDAGFVRRIPDAAMTTVPVQLGDAGSIASWPTAVFFVGLVTLPLIVAIFAIPAGLGNNAKYAWFFIAYDMGQVALGEVFPDQLA